MPLVNPTTSIGVVRSRLVPSPSLPESLTPQHLTPPPVVRAQVCLNPVETEATPLVRPLTSLGITWFVFSSWAWPVPSQHLTPPAVVTAHVCQRYHPPTETEDTPLARPTTSSAFSLYAVPPPSLLPIRPQHFRPPAVVRAQVLLAPTETAATPLVSPTTSTGFPLDPQHLTPPAVVTTQVPPPPADIATAGIGTGVGATMRSARFKFPERFTPIAPK